MKDPHVEAAISRILARHPANVAGNCPDANELAAFLESRLSPGETDRFEEHAAACADCRRALALSLQLDEPESDIVRPQVGAPHRSSYSTSPVRFALAAVVLLVVGVLLFKSSRDSQLSQVRPQVAREERAGTPTGTASCEPVKSTASAPAAAPASQMRAPLAAKRLLKEQIATASRETEGGRGKPSVQAAAPSAPAPVPAEPRLQAGADAMARATGVSTDAIQKEKPAQLADSVLKEKNEAVVVPQMKAQAAGGAGQPGAAPPQSTQLNFQAAQAAPVNVQVQAGNLASDNKNQQALPEVHPASLRGVEETPANRVQRALEQARALRQKDLPPTGYALPTPKGLKTAGERAFLRTTDYWVDAQCLSHEKAPSREITRDSKEYLGILAKEPALAELRPVGVPILIYWNGANLLIR